MNSRELGIQKGQSKPKALYKNGKLSSPMQCLLFPQQSSGWPQEDKREEDPTLLLFYFKVSNDNFYLKLRFQTF